MVKTLPYSFSTKQSVLDFLKIVLKRLHFYYVNDYFFQTLIEFHNFMKVNQMR